MMATVLERVRLTCEAIGPALLGRLTLVGGARQALLPLRVSVCSTRDIDFICATTTTLAWQRLMGDLEDLGFRPSTDEDAPICRYVQLRDGTSLVVDVMPTTDQGLGFSNRWYPEAHAHRVAIAQIPGLFAATPMHHLLTKIEAFKGRGARDALSSHDLEDIIAILVSMPSLLDDVERVPSLAHQEARAFLVSFARRDDAEDLLYAHLDSSAQGLVPALWARLRALP